MQQGIRKDFKNICTFGGNLDLIGFRVDKGFTNHELTDASGLIYMQGRFYAPQWHRFLSPDPARDQHFEQTQSWNIYSYVQNLPTMQIDPTGMILEEGERINRCIETIDEPGRVNVHGGYYLALTELSEKLLQTNAGAESLGQLLERRGMEAYEKGNTASWIGHGFLNAAYQVLTPGGDRLSQVNARAQNGEIVPVKDLAVAGGLALGQVSLAAAPQLLGAGKPLQTAVNQAVTHGGSKSQPINMFGKLRLEKHMEAVPKSVQRELGVKITGTIMKPWHISVMGHDITVNPFNPLWKLFK